LNVFGYSTVRSIFTALGGIAFNDLYGFGFYSSCNTSYYVLDHGTNIVYTLNDDWLYVSYKSFLFASPKIFPTYMIIIGSTLYVTDDSNLWKIDKNLNILIQYTSIVSVPNYRGIYHKSSNGFIYVAPSSLTEIQVFHLNLTNSHKISVAPYNPFSISEYNNKMYVGTTSGTILVMQNEIIINEFNGCNMANAALTSILFDQYGYMATSCDLRNKLYLYTQNGTYTGTSLSTPALPRYIGFDTKGRFVLISFNQISIYN
jgi:hypothetical protein